MTRHLSQESLEEAKEMVMVLMTSSVLPKYLSQILQKESELMESLISEHKMDRSEEKLISRSLSSQLHLKEGHRRICRSLKRWPILLNGRLTSSIELLKSLEDYRLMLS